MNILYLDNYSRSNLSNTVGRSCALRRTYQKSPSSVSLDFDENGRKMSRKIISFDSYDNSTDSIGSRFRITISIQYNNMYASIVFFFFLFAQNSLLLLLLLL